MNKKLLLEKYIRVAIKKAIQEGRVHWHEIAVDGNRAEITEE